MVKKDRWGYRQSGKQTSTQCKTPHYKAQNLFDFNVQLKKGREKMKEGH